MGVCNSCALDRPNVELLKTRDIKKAIEQQKVTRIDKHLEGSSLVNIDDDFHTQGNLSLNPLSYALLKGKCRSFIYIAESLNGSLETMERKLEAQGTAGLKIICELGYEDLLDYYLTRGPKRTSSPGFGEMSVSVDFSRSVLVPSRNYSSYTPVHIACELGHINILNRIKKHYDEHGSVPADLNIHGIDDRTGENCALIACRNGNFTMVKFLHEHCEADFGLLNKRRESCINIVVSASRRRTVRVYLDCLTYLVEVVGADLTYQYEESLLIAENPQIIAYLEAQLLQRGIKTRKFELELRNQIRRLPPSPRDLEKQLQFQDGCDFDIKQLMQLHSEGAEASVISDIQPDEHDRTPILSTLIPFS